MNAAPNLKYTDRDVRENDGLEDMAYKYLEQYEGEFQFLCDAKINLHMNGELSIGVVRGVLNCMRVDPRVPKMPEPLPYEPGEVLPMRQPRRRRKREMRYCDIEEFHEAHSGDGYYHCSGKYPINRTQFDLEVRPKSHILFVKARQGGLLHGVQFAVARWYPPAHEYGYGDCELRIKLLCKYPSVLKNPLLLSGKAALQYTDTGTVEPCPHCFPKGAMIPS